MSSHVATGQQVNIFTREVPVPEELAETFTSDELLRAFRLVMSDEEAQALWQRLVGASQLAATTREHQQITVSSLSDDLLLLLSVESEDLRRKVETFRRARLGVIDQSDDDRWKQRREKLKNWLDTTDRIG